MKQGLKFHFMLIITIKEDPGASTRSIPKIVFSKLSPPVHVDSRLAARSERRSVAQVAARDQAVFPVASVELFDPHLLMKDYFKKVKGKGKKEEETKIENSFRGLYCYLTAPNIKGKLRSLLFLAYRFSSCLKVFLPRSAEQVVCR